MANSNHTSKVGLGEIMRPPLQQIVPQRSAKSAPYGSTFESIVNRFELQFLRLFPQKWHVKTDWTKA
jgi:hypothetical protein